MTRIDDIERKARAARPGPWQFVGIGHPDAERDRLDDVLVKGAVLP